MRVRGATRRFIEMVRKVVGKSTGNRWPGSSPPRVVGGVRGTFVSPFSLVDTLQRLGQLKTFKRIVEAQEFTPLKNPGQFRSFAYDSNLGFVVMSGGGVSYNTPFDGTAVVPPFSIRYFDDETSLVLYFPVETHPHNKRLATKLLRLTILKK